MLSFKLKSDTAADGMVAQDKVKERFEEHGDTYQLILMDYSMPECNGPESVKGILSYLG